jgi:hypothetical protein
MKKLEWIKKGVVESFFRYKATAIPYRKTMGFLLGFIASLLLLTSWTDSGAKPIAESTAAVIFAVLLGLVFVLLVIVRPYDEDAVDRFTWGVLVIIVLGFGAGTLAFHYRENVVWLWHQSRNIDSPSRVILAALFLLGIILGFFVVRSWAKEQKDFVASVTAVFGGAFVASIVGKIDNGPALVDSFAAYALGFTLSGTINLIVAARLTASYTNRKTIASRAMLDFLYGSERAAMIDGYFLKNFKDDPNYAKAWLVDALIEFAAFAKRRFADGVEQRRKERIAKWRQPCYYDPEDYNRRLAEATRKLQGAGTDAEKAPHIAEIARLENKRKLIEKTYREFQEVDKEIAVARKELRAAVTTPETAELQARINDLAERRQALDTACQGLPVVDQQIAEANAALQAAQTAAEQEQPQAKINQLGILRQARQQACQELPNVDAELVQRQQQLQAAANNAEAQGLCNKIFQLETKRQSLAQLCQSENQPANDPHANGLRYYQLLAVESEVKIDPPPESEADRPHTIRYRPISQITPDLFRNSVSMLWQDALEYIVAPGEYKGTFPLMGSVSGLALLARQTIVMDRDRLKNFRSKDYGKGISPDKVSQQRGLDEIDFLSYISIPLVSRLGRSTENAVGILGMDTRLFLATDAELVDKQERESGTYSATLTGKTLARFATRLYEQNDKDIEYLEQIGKIVVPVLELYLKCRVGAT